MWAKKSVDMSIYKKKKNTDEDTNIKFWEDMANYVFKDKCKA